MDAEFIHDGEVRRVRSESGSGPADRVTIDDGAPFDLELRRRPGGVWIACRDGLRVHRIDVVRDADGRTHVAVDGRCFMFESVESDADRPDLVETITDGHQVVLAPMPGQLISLPVEVGDRVSKKQTVAVVVAMKMENDVRASIDGTVVAVLATEGAQVTGGQPLVEIEA